MFERPERCPGARLVATLAIGAHTRLVWVLVAILAVGKAKAFEVGTPVTTLAIDALVRAPERERRQVVVELNGSELALHRMALEAVLAQLSAVGIVVTGEAAFVLEQKGLCLHSLRSASGTMAPFALLDLEVQALERISGLLMVEPFRTEADQLHLVSVVVGVAADAIARLLSMESIAFSDPFLQIPVTGQAFLRFHALARAVAASAVLEAGQLGVGLTQGPGREQGVESLPRGAGCQER
jgi:hypothetical protein